MYLCAGFGINDKKGFSHTKEYSHWSNLIKRCYLKSCQDRATSYSGCSVSEEFRKFSFFYDWCQDQVGFSSERPEIDKDLLIKSNKIYSPETSVFLPKEINTLLIKQSSKRGEYPIGVYMEKKYGMLKSQIRHNGSKLFLGYFDNEDDAFRAYKHKKEELIKNLANKHINTLDKKSYSALMAYEVLISD